MNEGLKKRLARSLNREAWSLWENHGLEKDCVDDTLADLESLLAELAAAGYAVVNKEVSRKEINKLVAIFGHTRDHTRAFREAMLAAAEEEK